MEDPHAVLKVFPDGRFVHIGSLAGRVSGVAQSPYSATKHGLEAFNWSLRAELTRHTGMNSSLVEPGAIKTDFAGRSFDFTNDEQLTEYQGVVGKLFAALEPALAAASKPKLVAEVIFQAATDGTDQLRYTAGPDAEDYVTNRKAADDVTFRAGIKAQFGL